MKAIDRDGFVSIPNGKSVQLLIAESVLRFVQRVAIKNGVTAEQLMMGALLDEDIDSDAPVFLFCRVDPEGNTALLATQDNGPYRSQLGAARDGLQVDDPVIAVELTLGPEKGN